MLRSVFLFSSLVLSVSGWNLPTRRASTSGLFTLEGNFVERNETQSFELSGSDTWLRCAEEGQRCRFEGTQQVRFGDASSGRWKQKTATNGVECSNGVFGDPAPNAHKTCEWLGQPLQGWVVDTSILTPGFKTATLIEGTMTVPAIPAEEDKDAWNCWWLGGASQKGDQCAILLQPVLRYVPVVGGVGHYQMSLWHLGQQNGNPTVNASKNTHTAQVDVKPGMRIVSGIRQTGENKELKQQFFRQYWFIENDRSVGQVLDTWVYTGTIEGQVCDQNLAAVYGYVMEPDKIAAKQNLPANLNGLSMENLKVLDHNGQLLNTDDSKWKAERGGQPDWGIRIRSVKNGRSNMITTLDANIDTKGSIDISAEQQPNLVQI